MNKKDILFLLFILLFSYFLSYFFICDPNPIICIITYYIFFPNFYKAILIVIFHTYIISKYSIKQNYYYNNLYNNDFNIKFKKYYMDSREVYYFFSDIFKSLNKIKKKPYIFLILLVLFFSIYIFLFVNRIKIWV